MLHKGGLHVGGDSPNQSLKYSATGAYPAGTEENRGCMEHYHLHLEEGDPDARPIRREKGWTTAALSIRYHTLKHC